MQGRVRACIGFRFLPVSRQAGTVLGAAGVSVRGSGCLSVCLSVVRPPKWPAVLQVKHLKVSKYVDRGKHYSQTIPTGLPHDNGTGPDLLRSSFYF